MIAARSPACTIKALLIYRVDRSPEAQALTSWDGAYPRRLVPVNRGILECLRKRPTTPPSSAQT